VRFTAGDPSPFLRCDSDGDGALGLSDAVHTLDWFFRRGDAPACEPVADCNADGSINVSDVVYALRSLFLGGAPPPEPYPDCGLAEDPAERCWSQEAGC